MIVAVFYKGELMDEEFSNSPNSYSRILSLESCVRRLQSLIEVTNLRGVPMDAQTRRNVHDDLIEIRNFLLKYEKVF